MKHELLITGGSGFIGSRLALHYQDQQPLLPTHAQLDLTDQAALDAYLDRFRPRTIVHTAALSNTGYCQQHPEESLRVNVEGTENLARAAARIGAKLVLFSSDQIYVGSPLPGPHREDEPVTPSNVYGQHKREAELRALAVCPEAVCLRASWMYDLPVQGTKTSLGLPGALFQAVLAGRSFGMNPREGRGVTWAGLLVQQMDHILQLPGGIYNAGAENPLSSLETGCAFARLLGLAESAVCPADYPARDLSMDCTELRRYGIELGDTVGGLENCLQAYGLR